MEGSHKKRIVIIGAGFGGLFTYIELCKRIRGRNDLSVSIINPNDLFVFIPMIHEVAAGMLKPGSITQTLSSLTNRCSRDLVLGYAEHIDLSRRSVSVKDARGSMQSIRYDYLVLGAGSRTNFFGVPGASEFSYQLKTLADAVKIKARVVETFRKAEIANSGEEKRKQLSVAVIGGGATGVEIAGELADLYEHEMQETFPNLYKYSSIKIVDKGDRFLKAVEPWFGQKVSKILSGKTKIEIHHDSEVIRVTEEGVETGGGFIPASTVVWASGVSATEIETEPLEAFEKNADTKRIRVSNHLNTTEYSEVFAVGDQAWIVDKETGQPYPMRAQFAVREGGVAARNILNHIDGKPMEEFDWKEKGFIVSLGKGGALARIHGLNFSGPLAWFIYRTAYLVALVGWRAKIRTGFEWFLNIFRRRNIE